MSWVDIDRAISCKRALAAATSATAIPNNFLEMDLEAYLSASRAALKRHATRSAFSAVQTAMRAATPAAKTTPNGEAAEMVVRGLFMNMLWTMLRYSSIAAVLWFLYGSVHWGNWASDIGEWFQESGPDIRAIFADIITALLMLPFLLLRFVVRAIIQSVMAIFASDAFRERLDNAKVFMDRKYIDLRYNAVNDAVLLRYQLVLNWFGRYKKHFVAGFVFIWSVSTMIESKKKIESTEIFMEWTEVQRYVDEPIPEILFRKPKEFGSNSHYYREPEMTVGIIT